jgi:chemotaxis protein CheD
MTQALRPLAFAETSELLELANQLRRFFFDARLNATMVWVCQGDFYVTQNPNEVITTVLGSCVAVCVRDPELKVGGMNHFLLPRASDTASPPISNDLRYGSYSIERLINSIMAHGGRRDQLEIKIFGGAMISSDFQRIGDKNADFVESYLQHEGLAVAAQDLRGTAPRRLMYFPNTGRALVSTGRDASENRIFEIERKMLDTRIAEPKRSKPVLF